MRPVAPCMFYFKHFLARTPLAFSSQISLSEATRIPRFASLSVWSLILFTSDETRQQQHGQQSKTNGKTYCAFHKHANSKVQTPPSQLRFSLPSIIITFTSNEPCNTETCKTDRKPPITNHNPWPFEPVKVNFRFVRGPLRWLTAAKNAVVNWLLNFRIRIVRTVVVAGRVTQNVVGTVL